MMIKNLTILKIVFGILFLLFNMNVFAQNKYSVFEVNDKKGLVDVETLDEYVAPKYSWDRSSLFTEQFAFENKDSIIIVNKNTGSINTYAYINNHFYYYDRNVKVFILVDGKPAFLETRTMKIFPLSKAYFNATQNDQYMILQYDKGYDVYEYLNLQKPSFLHIQANKLLTGYFNVHNSNKSAKLSVFYGMKHILVYDEEMKLIKKINKKVQNEIELYEVLSPYFKIVESSGFEMKSGENYSSFNLRKSDNDYNYFVEVDNQISKYIKVAKGFHMLSGHSSDREGFVFKNSTTSQSYKFLIDFEKSKILLPKKYQKEMEIGIYDYSGVNKTVETKVFVGGAFHEYIKSNLQYPKKAKRKKVEGIVLLECMVNEDGRISDIKVIKGLGYGCDEEAVRLLQAAPKFIPATLEITDPFGETTKKTIAQSKEIEIKFQLPKK